MSQAMYTEREIKQVFEALMQERKHVEELIAENAALCKQGQQLKKWLKEEKESRQQYEQECHQLFAQGKQQQQELQEERQAELQAKIKSLSDEIEKISLKAEEKEISLKEHLCQKDGWLQQIQLLKIENQELLAKNEKLKSSVGAIDQEFNSLKTTVASAFKQMKELEQRFLKAVEEKMSALNQIQQLNREMDKLKAESEEGRRNVELQLECAYREKESVQYALDQLEANKFDYEEQIDSATRHVAKKIKEAALLQETIDKLNAEICLVHKKEESAHMEIERLAFQLQAWQAKEIEWQSRLDEETSKRALLEEKLFHSEALNLQSEQKLLELKEIEKKQNLLEELFTNFGSLLKSPIDTHQEKKAMTTSTNLFERPVVKSRTKVHLFE